MFRFKKWIDFLLYTNLYIGLCAWALLYFSYVYLAGETPPLPQQALIFGGTLALYGLHRIIGLRFVHLGPSRFQSVLKLSTWIIVVAGIGILLSVYGFIYASERLRWSLVPIMVLSLAYALPVFPGKKRLRDYPYIKIFLIGSLWTLLTIGIPVMHANTYSWYIITLLLLERFLFIFSLTIPFDLRDIRVDQEHKVWTIPMVLGIKWAKRLSMSLLLAALLLLGFLVYHFHVWSPRAYTILILTYGVAGWLIYKSKSHGSDYFFSIFIDGVMILPLLFEISWYYLHQLWHWIQ
ncbi:MAG: hypothetical protein KDC28_11455 [Saprospiraceae bacterium]|nr:hypothetical protein [Saprospiraceae bacterium]MCB9319171.1 hypothetical protein [Lewinellaceae bacterium]